MARTPKIADTPDTIDIPMNVRIWSNLVYEKWGVPVNFTIALCYVATAFGEKLEAVNNWHSTKAWSNEPRNPKGLCWFGDARASFYWFGATCAMHFKSIHDELKTKPGAYAKAMAQAWYPDPSKQAEVIAAYNIITNTGGSK